MKIYDQVKKIELWVENIGVGRLVIIALLLITLVTFLVFNHHDVGRLVEAAVITSVGIVTTINYAFIEKQTNSVIEEARQAGEKESDLPGRLLQGLFKLLNLAIFTGSLALLYFIANPYVLVFATYIVFMSFVCNNLVQTKVLLGLFSTLQEKSHTTGAFIVQTTNILSGENGPSMLAYTFLAFVATFFICYRKDTYWFATFSAGAATFHLFVSVFSFAFKFRNDPFEHVAEHIDWTKVAGVTEEQRDSTVKISHFNKMANKTFRRWYCLLKVSVVIVLLTSLVIFLDHYHVWPISKIASSNRLAHSNGWQNKCDCAQPGRAAGQTDTPQNVVVTQSASPQQLLH